MLHIDTIEIDGIAKLLKCSKDAAWKIVANKDLWRIPHCNVEKTRFQTKRMWDADLAKQEAERILELKSTGRNWKQPIVNHSYVMINLPVTQFPQNKQIREYFKC